MSQYLRHGLRSGSRAAAFSGGWRDLLRRTFIVFPGKATVRPMRGRRAGLVQWPPQEKQEGCGEYREPRRYSASAPFRELPFRYQNWRPPDGQHAASVWHCPEWRVHPVLNTEGVFMRPRGFAADHVPRKPNQRIALVIRSWFNLKIDGGTLGHARVRADPHAVTTDIEGRASEKRHRSVRADDDRLTIRGGPFRSPALFGRWTRSPYHRSMRTP